MNLVTMLSTQVEQRPDAVAIVDGAGGRSRRTTFEELELRSRQGAALLLASGLEPGDRVLLVHRMSMELYAALLSVLRLGMVAVFVEPSAGLREIDRCCARARPAAFIGSPKVHILRMLLPAVRRIPRRFALGARGFPGAVTWRGSERLPTEVPTEDVDANAPALMTLTSGSTGEPKATVRTHAFLQAQYEALRGVLQLSPGEVDLTTLPIVLLANLAAGATSIIPDADLRFPGSIEPAPVLAQMEACDVTRTSASPALLERLIDHCVASGRSLPRLTKIFTGGGPVFPGLLDRIHSVATAADVRAVYGSSEAEPIAVVGYEQIGADDRRAMAGGRGLLAGAPVPTLQLRILPDRVGTAIGPFTAAAFDCECLGVEQAGEIVVSGPHVLQSYLDGEGDADSKFLVDGVSWHRTGDAGLLDANGRLWLLGRCRARVVDARGVLYPFAAECAAMQSPAVRRAALVARESERILAVELRRRLDADESRALMQSLAWAGIDRIRAYPGLPVDRRHNAKIDYDALHRLMERTTAETIG
jgi:acyl-CoA synthetase (AMP-forming)/AMP-acid ligase II